MGNSEDVEFLLRADDGTGAGIDLVLVLVEAGVELDLVERQHPSMLCVRRYSRKPSNVLGASFMRRLPCFSRQTAATAAITAFSTFWSCYYRRLTALIVVIFCCVRLQTVQNTTASETPVTKFQLLSHAPVAS